MGNDMSKKNNSKRGGKSVKTSSQPMDVDEKPHKHVRVNDTPVGAKGEAADGPNGATLTQEPSVRSFAGTSSTRRNRSDPVMITDALADVREKPTAAQAMEHKWISLHSDPPPEVKSVKKHKLMQGSVRSTTFQKYLALQKLKKAALVVIASSLTQDQVGSLGEIFRRNDQSGDGTITLTELDNAIADGNFSKDIQLELAELKEELALSDSDTLNWKNFLAATMDKNLVIREDKIRYAFEQFKHSDVDYLTLEDFVVIFESSGQAEEIFRYLDSNRDGKVSFEDFRGAVEEFVDIGAMS
eukprot:Nitzschia sp. Nitz4//scaffold2_size372955//179880//181852//NITZ4_000425-RA/size372955-processed-gene-0.506-mRNA-1//-1//CDS//3329546784//7090//frame0